MFANPLPRLSRNKYGSEAWQTDSLSCHSKQALTADAFRAKQNRRTAKAVFALSVVKPVRPPPGFVPLQFALDEAWSE